MKYRRYVIVMSLVLGLFHVLIFLQTSTALNTMAVYIELTKESNALLRNLKLESFLYIGFVYIGTIALFVKALKSKSL